MIVLRGVVFYKDCPRFEFRPSEILSEKKSKHYFVTLFFKRTEMRRGNTQIGRDNQSCTGNVLLAHHLSARTIDKNVVGICIINSTISAPAVIFTKPTTLVHLDVLQNLIATIASNIFQFVRVDSHLGAAFLIAKPHKLISCNKFVLHIIHTR